MLIIIGKCSDWHLHFTIFFLFYENFRVLVLFFILDHFLIQFDGSWSFFFWFFCFMFWNLSSILWIGLNDFLNSSRNLRRIIKFKRLKIEFKVLKSFWKFKDLNFKSSYTILLLKINSNLISSKFHRSILKPI